MNAEAAEQIRYSHLGPYLKTVQRFKPLRAEGRVTQMIGHLIEATNPGCSKAVSYTHLTLPTTEYV